MKLLAIDSSGLTATVACMDGETMLGEYTIQYKKTHSQTLLPMIDQVVKMIEWDLKTIDAIAVAAGPGSFTGLRIGAATAKGLGLALHIPIVPVPTLEGLAYNLYGGFGENLVCPMMDARRNQVYSGIYEFRTEGMKKTDFREVWKGQAAAVSDVIEALNGFGRPVTFLGDGTGVQKEYIEENCHVPFDFAPPHLSRQKAGSVAVLGMQYLIEGKAVSAECFKPAYFRLSQAERERMEREKQTP